MGGGVSFCWLSANRLSGSWLSGSWPVAGWLAAGCLSATAAGWPSHNAGHGGAPVAKLIQQRTLVTGRHRPPGGDFSTGAKTPNTLARNRVKPTNRNTG